MGIFVKSDGRTSPFLWLGIPIAILILCIGLDVSLEGMQRVAAYTEGGPVEALQFLFMLVAVFLAALRLCEVKGHFHKLWVAMFLAGCIYIAGEEVSWGQWIFGWVTPDFWAGVNDQNETNLHNTSSWLDQKPRLLLFLGIAVGGLIVPALRRWAPSRLPTRFASLYPQDHMVVPALGVIGPYLVQEIAEHGFGTGLFERVSEIQELYIYYFILLYLFDLRKLKNSQL